MFNHNHTSTASHVATGSVDGAAVGMVQSIWWWRGNWWRLCPPAVPYASAWCRESSKS